MQPEHISMLQPTFEDASLSELLQSDQDLNFENETGKITNKPYYLTDVQKNILNLLLIEQQLCKM